MIAHASAAPTAQKESPASVDALNRAHAQRAPDYAHAATLSAPSQARTARGLIRAVRLNPRTLRYSWRSVQDLVQGKAASR